MSVPLDPIAQATQAALADIAANATLASTEAEQGTVAPVVEAAVTEETPQSAATEAAAPAAESTSESVATEQAITEATQQEAQTPAFVFKLKHKGKPVEVTDPEEVRSLAQKGFDYTQKSQQVAERERELVKLIETHSAQRENERAAIKQLLSDPATLRAVLGELERTSATPPQNDELVSSQQARAIAQQTVLEAQAVQRQQAEQVAQRLTAKQFETQKAEYSRKADESIAKILTDMPVLKETDGIEVLLLNDIAPALMERIQADPETVVPFEDVVGMLRESAQRRADKEKVRLENHTKAAVARAAKDKPKVQPVPPGGSAVTNAEQPKKFKFGDRALTQQAIADYEALSAANKTKR